MKHRLARRVVPLAALIVTLTAIPTASVAQSTPTRPPGSHRQFAVGPQYDSTHVYVTPGTEQAFVASWVATFGGTTIGPTATQVTPTPSRTLSELVLSPVGTLSVFDYTTPVPYPFGTERTGWLVTAR
ncbi:hypothetical protein [Streptomyces sp. NPDC059080]|uniref:hypothetical protein n=1 Tax=Streptomyces sp. NPDC059080 TaxID=3346718 RepID=UPI0036867929